MKYTRTTISIPEHVLELGQGRAGTFRLSFSDYLARLIDEDARSHRQTITLVAEEPPTPLKHVSYNDQSQVKATRVQEKPTTKARSKAKKRRVAPRS